MSDEVMYSREQLITLLQKNVVSVTFEKTDGNTRTMECTLMSDYLPKVKDVKPEEPGKKLNENILAVWDTDKQDWRSFRINSIKDEVKVIGNE